MLFHVTDVKTIIAPFASSIPLRWANRPFVRPSPSECEFRSDFGRLVQLDGQIVLKKIVFTDRQTDRQIQTMKSSEKFVRPVFTSDDLSIQMICSSSSVKMAIMKNDTEAFYPNNNNNNNNNNNI